MKKFFQEFKKFITRGNIVDMSVGVIVGGAFTAIVNGLTNNILKPLINGLISLILGYAAYVQARPHTENIRIKGSITANGKKAIRSTYQNATTTIMARSAIMLRLMPRMEKNSAFFKSLIILKSKVIIIR